MTINPIEVQELRRIHPALKVADVRHAFEAYLQAVQTLASNFRTVAERQSAIQTRDQFEAGINGHLGILLDSHDELVAALTALLAAYEYRVGDGLTPLITNARAALAKAEGRSL